MNNDDVFFGVMLGITVSVAVLLMIDWIENTVRSEAIKTAWSYLDEREKIDKLRANTAGMGSTGSIPTPVARNKSN